MCCMRLQTASMASLLIPMLLLLLLLTPRQTRRRRRRRSKKVVDPIFLSLFVRSPLSIVRSFVRSPPSSFFPSQSVIAL
jgi:uncharacterized membrane protein YadS